MIRVSSILCLSFLVACGDGAGDVVYRVRGVVRKVKEEGRSAVVDHEEIPGYMEAMSMPFYSKPGTEAFAATKPGDRIEFDYHVRKAEAESWVENLTVLGGAAP